MKFSEVEQIIREKYPPDSIVVRLFDDAKQENRPALRSSESSTKQDGSTNRKGE